jgi:hypothetical protein
MVKQDGRRQWNSVSGKMSRSDRPGHGAGLSSSTRSIMCGSDGGGDGERKRRKI